MSQGIFEFSDGLGPSKVIHIYEPSIGLRAILVVDNITREPLRKREDDT